MTHSIIPAPLSKFLRPAAITSCVLVVLFTLWSQARFLVAFFDGSLLDGGLDDTAEMIISVHSDVMTSALLLVAVMLFRRSLSAFGFTAALLGAFVLGVYDIMDNDIHPFIVALGVYGDVPVGGSLAGVNPQVTRMVAFFGLTATLFGLCLLKKTRTRDRIFVLLIAGAVIVTTFLFHIALPMGTLRFEKNRVADMLLNEARYMPLETFCPNRTCMFFDSGFAEVASKRIASDPLPFDGFVTHSGEHVTRGNSTKYVRSTSLKGATFAVDACLPRRDDRAPATDYMCFSDAHTLDGLGRTTAAWMGFLSSAAHATWLFGGTFLLFLHKRRFKIRRPATVR
ncbi:hypothetical protein [Rhizobium sp. BK176]|uniref:hypothetical protein n=1 Tax=Rhizobium sp. BK176 TaxID=2587071 RepID=UPI00216713CB|nr:hypothetical protein [Rhizobium sp. BK176]MCS4089434.1 hypothetical protein [Rhizobium sp. BK176]